MRPLVQSASRVAFASTAPGVLSVFGTRGPNDATATAPAPTRSATIAATQATRMPTLPSRLMSISALLTSGTS